MIESPALDVATVAVANIMAWEASARDPNSPAAGAARDLASERDAALADVRVFARHAWIQTPEGEPVKFASIAWPWQPALLVLWVLTKLCVVLKARQLGVSWLAAIYALWSATRRPGQSVLLISKGQLEAEKLLAKVAWVYERLPAWKPYAIVNARSIRFPALSSEIEALPATEGVGRSRTATLVILDEHAHQPFAHKIFLAVKAAAEHGKIISISSANGAGALHSQLYNEAKDGNPIASTVLPDGTPLPIRVTRDVGRNGWRGVFVPASADPARVGDWRERQRAEMSVLSDADFAQEYPENDVEAIQTSGRPVFRFVDCTRQPVESGVAGPPGLVIYRAPIAGRTYIIGADVGEGLANSDWSSAVVIERDTGEQMAQLRGRWTPDVYAERLDKLARQYGAHRDPKTPRPVVLGVERNNHGHAVLLRLNQLKGTDAAYEVSRFRDGRYGWLTTSATRPILVDQLEEALRTRGITLHDETTIAQLTTFHWSDDGKPEAQEGSHDDDVMALGIAWQVRRRSFGRVLGATGERAA